jgi:hypothetical protein
MAHVVGIATVFAALVCLFFYPVIFEGRTFGAGGDFASVMGAGIPA